jgi:hypothetical protein
VVEVDGVQVLLPDDPVCNDSLSVRPLGDPPLAGDAGAARHDGCVT